MINRRLLIYGAPKAATGGTLTVGNVGGFYGYSDGTAFKKKNLVFTFPELSLPAVTFHWYDRSPRGQIYYVTGADAGAPELWNWITGNPGEIIGFNVKVVSI